MNVFTLKQLTQAESIEHKIRGGTILPVSCNNTNSLSITREELFLLYVTGSNHVS